jgi:hypothetical protein
VKVKNDIHIHIEFRDGVVVNKLANLPDRISEAQDAGMYASASVHLFNNTVATVLALVEFLMFLAGRTIV